MKKICPTCNQEMTDLFLSAVCDYCDGLIQPDYYTGYVIYRGPDIYKEYVFRTVAGAETFRNQLGVDYPVKRVASRHPFMWRISQGTARGLEIADNLYEIYPDHRYPVKEKIAHIYEGGAY